MNNITENGFTILRFMDEMGFTSDDHSAETTDLMKFTGLDQVEFDRADKYLLDKGFSKRRPIFGTHQRFITAQGISFVQQELQQRLQISLNAERLLTYMVRVEPAGGYKDVEGVEIIKVETDLNLSHPQYLQAIVELE